MNLLPALARAFGVEPATLEHLVAALAEARLQAEQRRREAAEARADTLQVRLLDLESQIGNTTALHPVERGEEGVDPVSSAFRTAADKAARKHMIRKEKLRPLAEDAAREGGEG
jgi:hypothetical protein